MDLSGAPLAAALIPPVGNQGAFWDRGVVKAVATDLFPLHHSLLSLTVFLLLSLLLTTQLNLYTPVMCSCAVDLSVVAVSRQQTHTLPFISASSLLTIAI